MDCKIIAFIFSLLLISHDVYGGDLYIWMDSSGKTHYTNTAPPSTANKVLSGPSVSGQLVNKKNDVKIIANYNLIVKFLKIEYQSLLNGNIPAPTIMSDVSKLIENMKAYMDGQGYLIDNSSEINTDVKLLQVGMRENEKLAKISEGKGDKMKSAVYYGRVHFCGSLIKKNIIESTLDSRNISYEKDTTMMDRACYGGVNSEINESQGIIDSSDVIRDIIKPNCVKKWGTDYSMVEYCINKQKEAYISLQNSTDAIIFDACVKKWKEDFSMIKYCVDKQSTSKIKIDAMN